MALAIVDIGHIELRETTLRNLARAWLIAATAADVAISDDHSESA